jgi:hypothetical protein
MRFVFLGPELCFQLPFRVSSRSYGCCSARGSRHSESPEDFHLQVTSRFAFAYRFLRPPCGGPRHAWRTAETARSDDLAATDEQQCSSRGAARIRTGDKGFAVLCLTTWLRRRHEGGRASGARRLPPSESGKPDSNRRPQPWQGCALPTELFPHGLWVRKVEKPFGEVKRLRAQRFACSSAPPSALCFAAFRD